MFSIVEFILLAFMKNKNYSEILKQAIKNSGLKQKELAEKIGESQQTISNWLNRNDISLLSFIRICEGIDINPASIVDNGKQSDISGIDPRWLPILREIETKFSTDDKIILMEHILETVKKIRKIKENK